MPNLDRIEADIAPADRGRYTLDGDAAVEARIAADQRLIAEAVEALVPPSKFRALVLMGGYGRGEGGYVRRNGRPEPYNDYDYFVVVHRMGRSARRALAHALADRAKSLEQAVGVEVDFALLRDERLSKAEYSLMNAEMRWGHRVIAGDPKVLDPMPAMPFGRLPLGELTRLLLNRGALLLMNQQRLASGARLDAAQREVCSKYLAKAILACGDARLAGTGRYHPSYVVKRERLRQADWPGHRDFMALYEAAWENKFHPDYGRSAAEDVSSRQDQVVAIWLDTLGWLETVRLGQAIGAWEGYAEPGVSKGQDQAAWGFIRHLAVTARDLGPAEILRAPRRSLRDPRERLIATLPLLLDKRRAALHPLVADALGLSPGATVTEAMTAFLRLWRRHA